MHAIAECRAVADILAQTLAVDNVASIRISKRAVALWQAAEIEYVAWLRTKIPAAALAVLPTSGPELRMTLEGVLLLCGYAGPLALTMIIPDNCWYREKVGLN